MGKFALRGPASWSDILLSDFGGREESKRSTEGCSLWKQLWLQIEVILTLIFFQNTLPKGLANPLGMERN